jgi:cytochrome P450
MREAPPGGVFVAGHLIPGGSQVRVPSHIIHRDPENFERPLEYLPERWLKSSDLKVFNKGAFFPLQVSPPGVPSCWQP